MTYRMTPIPMTLSERDHLFETLLIPIPHEIYMYRRIGSVSLYILRE